MRIVVARWFPSKKLNHIQKKECKMFFAISPTKRGRFWWNLVHRFLNKFATKWYEHFSPRLHDVSTMLCETWNAHYARATVEFYRKKPQNFSHLNYILKIRQIWIQLITACGKYCKRRCTKHASLNWSYQRRHWQMAAAMTPPWRHDPAWSTPYSVAVSVRSDQWWVFWTPSVAIFLTCCNQVDSNLANFGATVQVGSWVSSCNHSVVARVQWAF